ncbi:MAG: aspartate aminotransferase family protein [Acidobacteria bacterium]|nr:aspartate aminotransferase family protein [Acidobacteriota bacterium]MBI3484746.1 aspartate aminotransferase family protein [Acidobacteriota bacterium]
MNHSDDFAFPRNFKRRYSVAVRGEGVYLYDENGKRYLDACGGAAVVSIGHGVPEIIDAIAQQARQLSYVHSSQFASPVGAELAAVLAAKFPGAKQHVRVHYTSGGSEATETAIKISRAYWLARGETQRYKIISRWGSYHGTTLGALSASGNKVRRQAFAPLLPAAMEHISACFCYRCPLSLKFPACALACAEELEQTILKTGKESVAAFICEPVVGASSGAVPPEGYLRRIREICDAHGILMIADEVMTGAGRTGKYFAVEHWGVVPDMILLAKGLASGYAPLGAVLAGEKIWRAIEAGPGSLDHGFTYQGHPPSLAAGLAVQRYLEKHNLVERSRQRGEYLAKKLEGLRALPCVGDVRGKGMLQTVEFVADKASKSPFAKDFSFNFRLFENMQARGVMVYPMRGTVEDGGDHVLIAPPYVIEEAQIDFLAEQMAQALEEVGRDALAAGAGGN